MALGIRKPSGMRLKQDRQLTISETSFAHVEVAILGELKIKIKKTKVNETYPNTLFNTRFLLLLLVVRGTVEAGMVKSFQLNVLEEF